MSSEPPASGNGPSAHALSAKTLPGVYDRVLEEFDRIARSEPETRLGKVVEVLAYWIRLDNRMP